MDKLRTPLFIVALAIMLAVVLVEAGSSGLVKAFLPAQASETKVAGFGVQYLALMDGLVLFTMVLIGASLLAPERIHGKLQGIGTFIVSIIVIIVGIVLIFMAFAMLMVMISFLLAVPFGTIVYFAKFSHFARGGVAATLSSMMFLKLAFAVCLVFAHQRFLQNKGLVLIIATSLIASIIVSFLHGLVPLFLVSITDAIAGIVVAIIAVIWGIFFLIGSIPAIIKAVTSSVPKA
jgi:hypothetical protein